jgi:hypothetical protein
MRWDQHPGCLCVSAPKRQGQIDRRYRVDVYPSDDLRRFASTPTNDLEQDAFDLCTASTGSSINK